MRHQDLNVLIMQVRPYRETSAIVRIFSEELGRFSAVFRGVRNSRSRVHLQAFVQGRLNCYGKGTLKTITAFEPSARLPLEGNQLSAGFYLLELVQRSLAEYQSEPMVFRLVVAALAELSTNDDSALNIARVLRPFELGLLQVLGFGIDFTAQGDNGAPLEPGNTYQFVDQVGFRPATDAGGYSGDVLQAVGRHQFDNVEVLRVAHELVQQQLRHLIGPEPLVSRALWTTPPHA